ncbi:DUF3788 family protein [Enterococcus sp. AZ192]|uniref:DUF3788 family protein n=1 Tax=unclassified Enterococcus TaxID=2608891 RepID=UPI003D276DFE
MTEKAQQLLRDPEIQPSDDLISEGLGHSFDVYVRFLEDLKEYQISLMKWRYYNDGKAWLSKGEYKWISTRGNEKVKPIFWLSIWDGFFKVSFFFSEKIRAQLVALPLSEQTKELINNTEPNGKKMQYLSLIFDVTECSQLKDIYVLAEFRKEHI